MDGLPLGDDGSAVLKLVMRTWGMGYYGRHVVRSSATEITVKSNDTDAHLSVVVEDDELALEDTRANNAIRL